MAKTKDDYLAILSQFDLKDKVVNAEPFGSSMYCSASTILCLLTWSFSKRTSAS